MPFTYKVFVDGADITSLSATLGTFLTWDATTYELVIDFESNDYVGDYEIRLECYDGINEESYEIFTITTEPNFAPFAIGDVTDIVVAYSASTIAVDYDGVFDDYESDALTYSLYGENKGVLPTFITSFANKVA